MLTSLMGATLLFSIVFGITGTVRFLKSLPMLNTVKTDGLLIDARQTDINLHSIENFSTPVDYLYYTYEYKGVTHGGNIISLIPTAKSRTKFKELIEIFQNQKQATHIDVYIRKNDPRQSFLLGPQDVSNIQGILGLIGFAATGILYLINKGVIA